ncbi:PREDICTED: ribonuclease P protein subunit p40-like [Polistes dominula]|uniref:Ribonuclease P protein subunit p40-like n=1 Tax=Polistes dominula TaxID=743375 RepID=A0ABM1HUU2_POLDO|nr:PREDICTED: ribonuclease P protein subunit p40-like [Polistes dominula]
MLSPEVWNFKPPQHYFNVEKLDNKKKDVPVIIKKHYFNHVVSLILPQSSNIPDIVTNSISDDSDYYKIKDLHVSELLNKQFIDAFVKKGELTLLAIGNKIDLSNAIAITPSGILIISLIREDFYKLGLEGNASFFDRKINTRNVVEIDLTAEYFQPGKKNYERVKTALENYLDLIFDVILIWEPPDENLCPSSVAAWFHQRGYSVSLCRQKLSYRSENRVNIPIVTDSFNLNDDFFEWLGVFSIFGDIKNEETSEYVNTYECPKPNILVDQVKYLQYTGFFSRQRAIKIYNTVREYVLSQKNLPWCSLHVQGFSDSPVSWDLKEHTFFTDGDNSYTILFNPNAECIIRKSLSSNNKLRIA